MSQEEYDYLYGRISKQPTKGASAPTAPIPSDYVDAVNRNQPTNYVDAVNRVTGGTTQDKPTATTPPPSTEPDLYVDAGRRVVSESTVKQDTYLSTKQSFDTANAEISTYLKESEAVIAAGGEGYDWSKYEGGYAQYLKDVENAKGSLDANQKAFGLWSAQYHLVEGRNRQVAPTGRELELVSQGNMLSPTRQHQVDEWGFTLDAASRLKSEGIISDISIFRTVKPLDTSGISASKGQAGYVLNVPVEDLTGVQKNDLKTLGFKLEAPPTPTTTPKTPTLLDNIVAGAHEWEKPFASLTGGLRDVGTNIYKNAQQSGNPALFGGALAVSGAMGFGAGAIDIGTYLIRPVAWWNTAQTTKALITNPVGTLGELGGQFAANPAYTGGYILGGIFGGKAWGAVGEAVYDFSAPKIPVVRDFYYAGKLGVKSSTLPEFAARENLLRSTEGVDGTLSLASEWVQGANLYLKGKANYAFEPFRNTLLNPARTPLGMGDLPAITLAVPSVARNAVALIGNDLKGITVNRGGIGALGATTFLDYAKPNYAFGAFRDTLLNPARTPLGWGDLGINPINFNPFGTIRGAYSFWKQSSPTPTIGGTPSGNPLIGAWKFSDIATVRSNTPVIKPDTGLSGVGGKLPSGMSPNKGFSIVDSGVLGKPTTPFERNLTAFMKNTFREPTPEAKGTSGIVAALDTTKSYPVSSRGMLPNPYYALSGTASVSLEIQHTGEAARRRVEEGSVVAVLGGLRGVTKEKPTLREDAKVSLGVLPIFGNLLDVKPIDLTLSTPRVVSLADTKIDPIIEMKSRTESLTEILPKTAQIQLPQTIHPTIAQPKTPKNVKLTEPKNLGKRRGRGRRRRESLEIRTHAIQTAAQMEKRIGV